MKLNLNQIFLLFFFISSLLLIFLNLRDASLVINPYNFGGWVISYTDQGFIKILGGELLLLLNKIFSIQISKGYILVNFLLYLSIICILIRKFFTLADDIKILSIFFPTSFVFLVLEPALVGRLEIIFLLQVSLIYLYIKGNRNYIPTKIFFLFNGIIVGLCLLFHRSFITFSPLLFLMILKYLELNYDLKKLCKNFLIFFLPQVLILFLISYFSLRPDEISLDPYLDKLPNYIADILREHAIKGSGYLAYLNSTGVQSGMSWNGMPMFFFVSSFIFNLFINLLFLIFVFSFQKFKLKKIDYFIILYLLLYLILFLRVTDWARYFFIQNMIILFFLNEERTIKIDFKILGPSSLLMALLVIPHGINNKFSMGLINSSEFIFNKLKSLFNMIIL